MSDVKVLMLSDLGLLLMLWSAMLFWLKKRFSPSLVKQRTRSKHFTSTSNLKRKARKVLSLTKSTRRCWGNIKPPDIERILLSCRLVSIKSLWSSVNITFSYSTCVCDPPSLCIWPRHDPEDRGHHEEWRARAQTERQHCEGRGQRMSKTRCIKDTVKKSQLNSIETSFMMKSRVWCLCTWRKL